MVIGRCRRKQQIVRRKGFKEWNKEKEVCKTEEGSKERKVDGRKGEPRGGRESQGEEEKTGEGSHRKRRQGEGAKGNGTTGVDGRKREPEQEGLTPYIYAGVLRATSASWFTI